MLCFIHCNLDFILIIFLYCVCWLVSCPKCNASRKISSFLKRLPTLYLLYHSYFPVHRFDKLPSYWLLINTINMVSHEENDIFFDIYLLICRKLDRHKKLIFNLKLDKISKIITSFKEVMKISVGMARFLFV